MKRILIHRNLLLFVIFTVLIFGELRFLEMGRSKEHAVSDEFSLYMGMVDQIFYDLQCFPVVKEVPEGTYPVTYSDTWGGERTYGGVRCHEGCDLMAAQNERGKYKICSMTDGVVKKIGWLEMGGWRIGIESDSGIYYYYAHLDSYEKEFQEGERVTAGQILGRMGDSGYGKEPGTKGNFDVHLHVGIYLTDLDGQERAVNPYWYLKHLEI